MSETRKVKLEVELGTMERTARSLGWDVWKNAPMSVVSSGMLPKTKGNMDLIIQRKGEYAIGFKTNEEGKVEAVFDDWKGYAQRSLSSIMPEYKAMAYTEASTAAGFGVERTKVGEEIVLKLRRG